MRLQIKDSVLNAIADDYENIETILETVQKFDSPAATVHQVSETLHDLIQDGLAQAYDLSPGVPHATKADFSSNRIDELWFYVTPEGKKFVQELNRQAK